MISYTNLVPRLLVKTDFSYNLIFYNMKDFSFPACATCIHMRIIAQHEVKAYDCSLVIDDIPSGRVHPTFDADKCIQKGRYVKRTR